MNDIAVFAKSHKQREGLRVCVHASLCVCRACVHVCVSHPIPKAWPRRFPACWGCVTRASLAGPCVVAHIGRVVRGCTHWRGRARLHTLAGSCGVAHIGGVVRGCTHADRFGFVARNSNER